MPQNGAFVTNNSLVYHTDGRIDKAATADVARIRSLFTTQKPNDSSLFETQKPNANDNILAYNSSMEKYIRYNSSHLDIPEALLTAALTTPRNRKRRGAVEADMLAKNASASVPMHKRNISHAIVFAGKAKRLRAVFAVSDMHDLFGLGSVDVVYVRVRNDYCRASQDMRKLWSALRLGGVVFGDEYNNQTDVPMHALDVCGGW